MKIDGVYVCLSLAGLVIVAGIAIDISVKVGYLSDGKEEINAHIACVLLENREKRGFNIPSDVKEGCVKVMEERERRKQQWMLDAVRKHADMEN